MAWRQLAVEESPSISTTSAHSRHMQHPILLHRETVQETSDTPLMVGGLYAKNFEYEKSQ